MSDLDTAIADLTDKHLLCRDLGHRWAKWAHHTRLVEWANERVAVVERIVRCTVCRTVRTEQMRRSDGVMIRRRYSYPDGYRFARGVVGKGGLSKAPFRTEWMARVVKEDDR